MLTIEKSHPNNKYLSFRRDHMKERACFLTMTATGHYWRTSYIRELSFVIQEADGFSQTRCLTENEPDEYDLLEKLPSLLGSFDTLYTFNGTAFVLPYLARKYHAYRLEDRDPFVPYRSEGKNVDLLRTLRPFEQILGLPSLRLRDFNQFFKLEDSCCDAALLAAVSVLSFYKRQLKASPSDVTARLEDGFLILRVTYDQPFPAPLSYRDDITHVRYDGHELHLAVPVKDGCVRLYYPDYENYDYLPAEGYAVHKSLSAFISASHRVKAEKTTCYSLIPAETLIKNERRLISYLTSLLNYLI